MPRKRTTITPCKTRQQVTEIKRRRQEVRQNESAEDTNNRRAANAGHMQAWRQRYNNRPLLPVARHFPPVVQPFTTGTMDKRCPFCGALQFQGENHNCCHGGKVDLPPLTPYPQELKDLLTQRTTPNSRNFHENIRQYNSAMAFASFGANIVSPPGHGPYAFKIHGQIYHRSGSLYPGQNTLPSYSQLYVMEASQALQSRMQQPANQGCRPDILQLLTVILERINPYAAAYKRMHEVELEQRAISQQNNTGESTVTMHILRGNDQKRYNDPRQDEIAVIFTSQDGAPPSERDIAVHPRNQPPRNISYMSSNIDPMVYPLFFPHGELGWIQEMEHDRDKSTAKRNHTTCLQFYAHRLSIRDAFSPIFYGGKLMQQYIVDAYVRVEAGRLNYVRTKQSQLRVDMYQGLMDHINSQAEQQNLQPGKVVILPSSFQGSPRAMQQNYQDAMAIVRKYGKPDIFLTFTCNPKCKDVQDALFPGQQAQDRPDIVARVFHRHLKELLHDITKLHVLGKPVAHVHVIEFQKRGLPHCHLLLILAEGHKLREPADIDSLISAEIPDPATQPELYNIVKSTMVHGPCGLLNPNSPCMQEGKCSKDYPKQFQNETAPSVDGYPHYQRRDNGRTITIGTHEIDNRWIVPYNPYLTKKYQAHINVEACTSIKSVKYLFKYVYKGHDCANVQLTETSQINHDEVSSFLDARYVSAPEAYWRLAEYKLHQQSHAIVRLQLHLPNHQPVYFTAGNHTAAAEACADRDTMLTAYFKANTSNPNQLCYHEFPNYFVFDQKTRTWKPRQRGAETTIGRVYSASPKDMERFCLRLLLHHVPSPTSYNDLKTVDGVTVNTFQEACLLRQLLADDKQWSQALEEAATFSMPRQLRTLLATILVYCQPAKPVELWDKYKRDLCEDFLHNSNHSVETAEQLALHDINDTLRQNGMSLSTFGFEPLLPIDTLPHSIEDNIDVETEERTATEQIAKLNPEQRQLVDSVIQALQTTADNVPPRSNAYFLDGPGGTGKTMVYNTLIAYCRSKRITVAPSAWTGIAATLLVGGRTVHSLFKLPVPVTDTSTCNISPTSQQARYLKSVSLFIIDEASMVPANALKAIDILLQDITGLKTPFGGKVFLMGGDFRQVLPVVPRQPRAAIIENCLKRSPLWPHFTIAKLTKNMRAQEDQQQYAQWLLQLGNGQLQYHGPSQSLQSCPPDSIEIPTECHIVPEKASIVDAVFTDLTDPEAIANTVILTPTNDMTLKINDMVINKLEGQSKTYLSADRPVCDDETEQNNYPIEFLNSITPTGMPPHRLILKKGAIIMLLRNLDIKQRAL